MAKKKKKKQPGVVKKYVPSTQCPTNLKPDEEKTGMCFKVERIKRNGHKGDITSFTTRSSGRSAGYSTAPGACKRTMDPFQASIRTKENAEKIGHECSKQSSKKK
jgi:hypothetical protein